MFMRVTSVVVLVASWVMVAVPSYGQIRPRPAAKSGSAEANQRISDYQGMLAAQDAEFKRDVATGLSLFGEDAKMKGKEYAGTLAQKNAPDFKIGDWGQIGNSLRVISKVSGTECLVLPDYKGSEVMLLRGLDMSKVTDGVQFILPRPVAIQETYTYVAVSQAKKTVLVLEADPAKVNKASEKARAAIEAEAKKKAEADAEKAKENAKKQADADAARKAKKEAAAKFEPDAKKELDDIKRSRYLPTVALKKLRALIEKYPDTDAAEEAQGIIDEKMNRSQPAKLPIRRR